MLHLRTEPTWRIAHFLVNHLRIIEIILVLILSPGQIRTLVLSTRKCICAGYYCYQFLRFQQNEYIYQTGFKPRFQHSPYTTNFQFNQQNLMV
jgi:hypothetical protein